MKFNLLSKAIPKAIRAQVSNFEGAKAYTISAEMELYTTVVTWGLNDSFYEKDEGRLTRLRGLIAKCNPRGTVYQMGKSPV